jgi:hypothetical protein
MAGLFFKDFSISRSRAPNASFGSLQQSNLILLKFSRPTLCCATVALSSFASASCCLDLCLLFFEGIDKDGAQAIVLDAFDFTFFRYE